MRKGASAFQPQGGPEMQSDEIGDRPDREHRPSPIDVHVGGRVRLRRTLMGMSQERLGEGAPVQATLVQRRPVGGREETAVIDTASADSAEAGKPGSR